MADSTDEWTRRVDAAAGELRGDTALVIMPRLLVQAFQEIRTAGPLGRASATSYCLVDAWGRDFEVLRQVPCGTVAHGVDGRGLTCHRPTATWVPTSTATAATSGSPRHRTT